MQNLKFVNLIIVSLFILSCGNTKSSARNTDNSPGNTSPKSLEIVSNQIKGTLRSKLGQKIFYTFDNSVNTMEIVFNSETLKLKRELTASGIKYSNENYTYTEWHGTGILSKNGVKIFEGN